MDFDVVIENGRFFDGTSGPSAIRNVGIRNGHVAAITEAPLSGIEEIDATGQWVLPGLIDIHTHYDVELLDGPALSESLRHGVTTVMVGSCSISTARRHEVTSMTRCCVPSGANRRQSDARDAGVVGP